MSQLRQQLRSKWPILLCVLVSFVAGFGISFVSRTETPPAEAKIQIADFRVQIPEGETIITISDRQPGSQELGRLTLQRRGHTILGVSEVQRQIAPRERLSADGAAFLRREVGAALNGSDSAWERANKLRLWLAQRSSRLGMPGLSTRNPAKLTNVCISGTSRTSTSPAALCSISLIRDSNLWIYVIGIGYTLTIG